MKDRIQHAPWSGLAVSTFVDSCVGEPLNRSVGCFLMRRRKRIRLTPMQRAILFFPGSDGLVSLRHMLDHLWDLFPKASREAFIDEVGKALLKLWHLGDLYLERQYGLERRSMTVDECRSFSLLNFVEWDCDGQRWTVSPGQAGVDDVFVQLSQGGINDLRSYEIQAKGFIAENE